MIVIKIIYGCSNIYHNESSVSQQPTCQLGIQWDSDFLRRLGVSLREESKSCVRSGKNRSVALQSEDL